MYFEMIVRRGDSDPKRMKYLKESVIYNPGTGDIKVKDSRNIDDTWVSSQNGHRYMKIDGIIYSARRMACLVMTGNWPQDVVFHLNEDKADIKWSNLSESAKLGLRLTQKEISKRLDYDPITGCLRWKNGVTGFCGKQDIGIEINKRGHKYLKIGYEGRHFIASNLIWLIIYDRLPKDCIIYLDGDGLNNELTNLKEVSNSARMGTAVKPKNNKSGFKGVSWDGVRSKFVAYITVNKKRRYLGRSDSKVELAEAYDRAAIEAWGEIAMTNQRMGLFDTK